MASTANRRPVMTLYSRSDCPLSHRVRIVLAEKNITADIVDVDIDHLPEDLIELNSYNTEPTLVDRDLVLYDSNIIMEYLDERFPHPPLMPVDPVSRARARMMLYRVNNDWYGLLDDIHSGDAKRAVKAAKELRDGLILIAPAFVKSPYFMSEEAALIDCSLAALLWRLPSYGIELPPKAKPVMEYAKRLFDRDSFNNSLSESERELTV
jgi:RNA polymerase-associated protein